MEDVYGMSKLGINIYPRILMKEEKVKEKEIQVYSLCPGGLKLKEGN